MANVNVLILVDKAKKTELDRVADELAHKGLKVQRKMKALGIISGSADSGKLDALSKVAGVSHLREEGEISLPPMDDKTPQ